MNETPRGSPPLEAPLLRLLQLFMRHSVDDMAALLRERGLSLPQIATLQMIRAEGAQTISAIADHLNLSLGATSHLIERLVQKGLVARAEDPADRRQKLVSLAPGGRSLIAEVDERSAASMRSLLEDVPIGERERLLASVATVVASLEERSG